MFDKFEVYFGALLIIILFQLCIPKQIDEIFEELELVSDLELPAPKYECNVSFFDNDTHHLIRAGEVIPLNFRPIVPKVEWPEKDNNTFYTLYVIGITKYYLEMDSLRNNNTENVTKAYMFGYEWHNWVIVNIPGKNLFKGQVLYPYIQIGSPSKAHLTDRYAFLIFEQSRGNFTFDPPLNNKTYIFNELSTVKDFVKKYQLGDPVFGTALLNNWYPITTPEPVTAE